jgi:uncharacterized membrane protein YbhN (UPF0104 family)
MRRCLRPADIAVGLLATAAFLVDAIRMGRSLDMHRYASMRSIVGIALAALGSAAIIPISAFAWMRLLSASGENRRRSDLATIMGVSQFAKYLPGNVGQHAGRLGLSIHAGIRLPAFTARVLAESILAILAAVAIGVAGCAISGAAAMKRLMPDIGLAWIDLGAVLAVLAIVAMVAATPRGIARLARHRLKREHAAAVPTPGRMLCAFGIYVLNYIVLGMGLTAMAWLVARQSVGSFPLLTGAFAMPWILGFFTPGAPAGLGVCEGVMLALLNSAGIGPDALVIVIAIRLATTAGGLLCFVTASAARLISRRPGPNESTAGPHGGTRTQR